MNSDSLRTDIPPYPMPRVDHFTISTSQSAEDMTATLHRLFNAHPKLRDALPCHRYGPNNAYLLCFARRREDLYKASFDPEGNVLTVELTIRVPANSDRSYKPDYKYYADLRSQIRDMLVMHFGAKNVHMKDYSAR